MSAKKRTAYEAMIASEEKPAESRFFFFVDARGVAAISPKAAPTREDFIDAYLRYPKHTANGRNERGEPTYDVHHYTREEAEAKVDSYLASLRADAP